MRVGLRAQLSREESEAEEEEGVELAELAILEVRSEPHFTRILVVSGTDRTLPVSWR